ncbi:hypothetical protein ACLF3G_02925 [Falsiroseomonas sp. HC035]|uniref:hypothetical protein n=1 Tax=Falsiroseomonas sp. HC035 TaxID=3390999 RepID=UPI003D314E81
MYAAAELPRTAAAPLRDSASHPTAPPAPRFRIHLFRLILATCLPLAMPALAFAVWTPKQRQADALRSLDAATTTLQITVDRELRLTVSMLEVLGGPARHHHPARQADGRPGGGDGVGPTFSSGSYQRDRWATCGRYFRPNGRRGLCRAANRPQAAPGA